MLKIIAFHNNDQVSIKNCCYGNVQSFDNMSAILDFLKIIFSAKMQANFLEISRKHMFTASNTNIIKIRVEKKKLKQILLKSYSFRFQTLICISNSA